MQTVAPQGVLRHRVRRVLVVGGLTRLQSHYRQCLHGLEIEVANANDTRLKHSIAAADAILVLVPHVSHAAVARVRDEALRAGVLVAHASSSGVGEVKRSILALLERCADISHAESCRDHALAG